LLSLATAARSQRIERTPALDSISVTARRISQADQLLTTQVAAALRTDKFADDDHVTVTVRDGVVTLHGLVLDYWDVQALKRLCRKVAGVNKVVNDLDVRLGGE
jgi:osmotically-inducible protein OsmY